MTYKSLRPVLVVLLVLSVTSLALARGAPTKEKVLNAQVAISAQAAPVITSVPPMTTGYDVIQNLSASAHSRLATANYILDTLETGLSTTGDERAIRPNSYLARSGPPPSIVLLA